jgi:hypothetical protein
MAPIAASDVYDSCGRKDCNPLSDVLDFSACMPVPGVMLVERHPLVRLDPDAVSAQKQLA